MAVTKKRIRGLFSVKNPTHGTHPSSRQSQVYKTLYICCSKTWNCCRATVHHASQSVDRPVDHQTAIKNGHQLRLNFCLPLFQILGVSHFAFSSQATGHSRVSPRRKRAMMARPSWTSLCLGLLVLVQSEYTRSDAPYRLEFIEPQSHSSLFQLQMDSTHPAHTSGIGQNSFDVSTPLIIQILRPNYF